MKLRMFYIGQEKKLKTRLIKSLWVIKNSTDSKVVESGTLKLFHRQPTYPQGKLMWGV